MPDTYIIYRFFFEWLEQIGHPLSMKQWVNAINALSSSESEVFFTIIHASDFSQPEYKEEYGERINHALSFYVNMRDEISDSDGNLKALKDEFDALEKSELSYIKESFVGVLNIHK